MRFARGIFRWLSSLFLHTTLLLFILSFAFVLVFGNKQVTKDALIESDVYNQFVPALITDNIKASEGKRSALPFDDPEIQKIAVESFAPVDLKEKTESFVDQLFRWLDGTDQKLSFVLDLEQQRNEFIDRVSTYAANRLGSLPNCTQVDLGNTTVFELECRPENVPLSFVKDKVREDLLASDFLKEVRFTEADLPKVESGKHIQDQYDFAPQLYQLAQKGIWIASILFGSALMVYVFLRRPMRKGMRKLGRDLFSSAAAFLLATIVFGFILPRYTNSFTIQGGETTKLLNNVFNVFVKRFDVILINVSLQIFAAALVIVVIEKMSRPASLYARVGKKAGLSTSLGTKKTSGSKSKLPPVQTSEVTKIPKKRKKGSAKYRKMGL
ncbi:hypothetical protein KC959_02575 [Candidatus Saccharibacteria bacterium]|nr:hypothetical protein [Candidatus Saccharibacteria bacterium]